MKKEDLCLACWFITKPTVLSEDATPAVIKQRRASQPQPRLWLIISRNQSLDQQWFPWETHTYSSWKKLPPVAQRHPQNDETIESEWAVFELSDGACSEKL